LFISAYMNRTVNLFLFHSFISPFGRLELIYRYKSITYRFSKYSRSVPDFLIRGKNSAFSR
jgi:hypothetical protein